MTGEMAWELRKLLKNVMGFDLLTYVTGLANPQVLLEKKIWVGITTTPFKLATDKTHAL
jgi:hypothetical protein